MGRRRWTTPVIVVVALATATVAGCGADEPTASPVGSSASPTTAIASSTIAGSTADEAAGGTADEAAGGHSMDGSMTTMAPTRIASDIGMAECPQRMPGELLAADEAVVRFSPQSVCLGYLTVPDGTPIQWTNLDTVTHTVSIVDDDEQPVESFEVAAGETHVSTTPEVGIYRFRTTAIESFTGTIEVQAR